MAHFNVRVEVWLKSDLVDAEGKMVEEALKDLGYLVNSVRVGKVYTFKLESESLELAKRTVVSICGRLLANPVKDIYSFNVIEDEA